MARVNIPKNPDNLEKLMDDIIEHENAIAPNGVFNAAEIVAFKAFRDTAKEANKIQKAAFKLAEEKTKERDNALGIAKGMKVDQPGTGMYLLTKHRDKLLADNKENPKKLGEWGYEVDDSPKPPKKPKP